MKNRDNYMLCCDCGFAVNWIVFLPFTIMALIYWILTVGRNSQ